MSIKLMAAAWELNIPSTEKMVLLCLCDFSNDAGVCWPSVPTIARKCSKGDRTIQGALQWLRSNGFCSWDETPGRPHKFTLNPRKICTPAETAPPQKLRDTPAEVADEPSITTNVVKAKALPTKRGRTLAKKPDSVSDSVWRDWLAHRKTAFTDTALEGFEREATKIGWTLEAVFRESIERSWQGFKADWVKGNGTANRTGSVDRRSSLARAIDEGIEFLAG